MNKIILSLLLSTTAHANDCVSKIYWCDVVKKINNKTAFATCGQYSNVSDVIIVRHNETPVRKGHIKFAMRWVEKTTVELADGFEHRIDVLEECRE